ncbi:uncharacterized protein LOC117293389 [Asterias rubens]|uniref:uncharacterized protein LOC117293389 n=1 Tax=Asterias rubens TaxID=7604 RepID=UPI00145599F8|nr:uncharacterized protein LOC117293389 [Asterias rubens]
MNASIQSMVIPDKLFCLWTPESKKAAGYFRSLLTKTLGALLIKVKNQQPHQQVTNSLRSISATYRSKLGLADAASRPDWDDPANRCAYVFLYFMKHSHLVFLSLQPLQRESYFTQWSTNGKDLRICSLGGGPGSELVGMAAFLRENDLCSVSRLKCTVLELFPSWKETWDSIHEHVPELPAVEYIECDLVHHSELQAPVVDAVKNADIVTMVKTFSTISAFIREDGRAQRMQTIFREMKKGALLLFIDNENASKSWEFLNSFILTAGMTTLYNWSGKTVMPSKKYSATIKKFSSKVDFKPMRFCKIRAVLLQKV